MRQQGVNPEENKECQQLQSILCVHLRVLNDSLGDEPCFRGDDILEHYSRFNTSVLEKGCWLFNCRRLAVRKQKEIIRERNLYQQNRQQATQQPQQASNGQIGPNGVNSRRHRATCILDTDSCPRSSCNSSRRRAKISSYYCWWLHARANVYSKKPNIRFQVRWYVLFTSY